MAIILALLAWIALGSPADAADAGIAATKRVLVFFSYTEPTPFTANLFLSLRRTLTEKSPYPVELDVEYTNRVRHPEEAYLQKYVELLQLKYSQTPPAAILAFGDETADIILPFGEQVFGKVPMVLVTAIPRYRQVSAAKPYFTNLDWGVDVKANTLLIEEVLPEARHLFIVSGAAVTDRQGADLARTSLKDYQGPLQIHHLSGVGLADLRATVADLPQNAALLFLTYSRDPSGVDVLSQQVFGDIAKTANAPVFSVLDINFGLGMVGGMPIRAKSVGESAAEIAVRLLKGESPQAIGSISPRNPALFDWRQLQKWGIDEKRLPHGSEVLFKELSLWERHRKQIVSVIAFLVFQTALIVLLLTANVRRRRAEVRLKERLLFEDVLAGIFARFVGLPPDKVDEQIGAELKTLGECLQVDRITVFDLSETDQRLSIAHSYVAAAGAPPPAPIEFSRFPWAQKKLRQGESFHFSDPDDLPPEAEVEKAFMQSQGVKSAVVIPIMTGGSPRGILALGMVTHSREWFQEMIRRYEMVAQVIAHALARKLFNEALAQSRNFNRSVLDSLPSHIAVLDRQGGIVDVNESWMRFARDTDAGPLERIGVGVNYLDVCRDSAETGDPLAQAALEGVRSVLEGSRELFFLEYPFDTANLKRWFLMKVLPFSGFGGGVIVTHIDISEQKQVQVDLKTAYLEIEQLKTQLEAETAYLQEEIQREQNYEGIIGQSPAIQYVLYKVKQVAATDTTVLVLGESGTGKELICRTIHNHSPRKSRPLVKVNCAALPANLIESELFGHERGAFTGAQNRRTGRFELADGTAIFLDEIGELPLELQGKLLRVLQDGEFERLGSSITMKVDVRVIAATNRDLETQVREGSFREDLYYRLNVFPITVPPLRERREDIPMLTRFYVEQFAKKLGKPITSIPKNVMEQLQAYRWPGNVRELQNVIERAAINSPESKLQLMDDLCRPGSNADSETLKSLQQIETRHIEKVLEATNWRIDGPKGAAMILKINPSTLRSRMRKLGINKP